MDDESSSKGLIMGKGIILRAQDGTALPRPALHQIQQLIPGYEVKKYPAIPNYSESIKRRIDSLYDAFLFLLDAYPLDPSFTHFTRDNLITYLNEVKSQCDLTEKKHKSQHRVLERFTNDLLNVIAVAWKWSDENPLSEVITCLNEAEQFMLMQRGRPDIVTVTPFSLDKDPAYLVQQDISLDPLNPELIEELEQIKALDYLKTPAWFHQLEAYQKAYLFALSEEIKDKNDIIADLVKLKAFLTSKEQDSSPVPEPNFSTAIKNMLSELEQKETIITAKEINTFIKFLKNKEKKDFEVIFSLPSWYLILSPLQQIYLAQVLKTGRIVDVMSSLPSRLRVIPAPANYGAHRLLLIHSTGEIEELSPWRYRSSHMASRDLSDGRAYAAVPENVQLHHANMNLKKVMEHAKSSQTCLVQTLISPEKIPPLLCAVIEKWISMPPDYDLHQKAHQAINGSTNKSIVHSNHPFNVAKYHLYTSAKDSNFNHLLTLIRAIQPQTPELTALIDNCEKTLNSGFGTATFADYYGRELCLSTLEQLMILELKGYSYGSCVSGKDRKAIEIIHTDAAIAFKKQTGRYPNFHNPSAEERQLFVNLVTTLYNSGHHQVAAGLNAPGSEGIKTPRKYFPPDVSTALDVSTDLNESPLTDADRLASLNEVKAIGKFSIDENKTRATIVAYNLGEETCERLYTVLFNILGEEGIFKKATPLLHNIMPKVVTQLIGQSPIPAGITQMRAVCDGNFPNATTRIAKMMAIALSRLSHNEKDSSRRDATNTLYNGLRSIIDAVDPQEACKECMKKLNSLFKASLEENASRQLTT